MFRFNELLGIHNHTTKVSLSNNIEHIGDSEDDSDEEFNGKLFQMKVI